VLAEVSVCHGYRVHDLLFLFGIDFRLRGRSAPGDFAPRSESDRHWDHGSFLH